MKVQYDKSLKIAGVSIQPWARIGPEQWFDNYKIASLAGWNMRSQNVEHMNSLAYVRDQCEKPYADELTTQALLQDPIFQDMIITHLPEYHIFTYKPFVIPERLKQSSLQFLPSNDMYALAQKFENKSWFRRIFAERLCNIPPHKIYPWREMLLDEEYFSSLCNGRSKIVLQDATLGGGKGSFIVDSFESFCSAINTMQNSNGLVGEVFVSDYIADGRDWSVQGVVTRYGVFIGPVQRQIIADPNLSNTSIPGTEKFCGIEILADDQHTWQSSQLTKNARVIGQELYDRGYRGIFGVDSLVTDDTVYTIEVNARITGATPLLTMSYNAKKHIPFYLLHILELTNSDYTIEDSSYSNDYNDCALMVLHQRDSETGIADSPRSGLYNEKMQIIGDIMSFDRSSSAKQVFVQDYTRSERSIARGSRLASIFTNFRVMDEEGVLMRESRNIIDIIENSSK